MAVKTVQEQRKTLPLIPEGRVDLAAETRLDAARLQLECDCSASPSANAALSWITKIGIAAREKPEAHTGIQLSLDAHES